MKVLPFKIPKPIDSVLIVQEDKVKVFYSQLHQHEEVQISYIKKGSGKLIVANSVHAYNAGDIFIIGSNTPHLFRSVATKEISHMITLFVTPDNFGTHFFEIPEMEEVKQFMEFTNGGIRILSKRSPITKIMERLRTTQKLETFRHFLKLVHKVNLSDKQSLARFVPSKKISNTEGRRLQLVFEYAMNNFQNEITLNDVAEIVSMTVPAFCRFFKRRTNKTFFEFLIDLRIAHARQLLMNSEKMPIAEISEASGFQSISNFNRKFKEITSVSPSAYTRKMGVS